MSFDAIAIAAVAAEIRERMLGGRVQKIVQADEHTFGLELYSGRERRWLLLSADPQDARVHLSRDKVGRAEITTPLLLLMRKHLRGARLFAVEQPDFERVLRFTFATFSGIETDEDAEREVVSVEDAPRVTLIIEAIGRYSNVILVDQVNGQADGKVDRQVDGAERVLECAKRVTSEINRYRVVLPRHPYVPPPAQSKVAVESLDASDLGARLGAAEPKAAAYQVLVGAYAGLSPQVAREAVFRATGKANTPASAVSAPGEVVERLRELLAPRATGIWQPSVARKEGSVVAFAPYPLTQHAGFEPIESISAAIEAYFSQRGRFRPVDQAREVARKPLAARREAAKRKQESLERALAGGHRAEALRLAGETILAHIHEMGRGLRELKADGLEIALDPGWSASDNAQAYFKRYRKAKAALAGVPALLEETRLYLAYLDQAAAHLEMADNADQVRAVQRELAVRELKAGAAEATAAKQPKRQSARGGKSGRAADRRGPSLAGLARYLSSDGVEILVGRSGRLNDTVTFELAGPDDIWLHARNVPGAHVILRTGGAAPSETALAEAAQIAAYYCTSREATTVPVDWTKRRLVRRIREGLPGLVNFSGERTVQVRPEVPVGTQRLA